MNYYDEIKREIINNEVTKRIKEYSKNRSDLNTYFNIGKLLSEAGKHYGEGIIKEYSKKLTKDLKKNISARLLYKTIKFYNYMHNNKLPTVSANLSWSHYDEILKFNDTSKINYYIYISSNNNLIVRELRNRIKSHEYERLDDKVKDVKNKIYSRDIFARD